MDYGACQDPETERWRAACKQKRAKPTDVKDDRAERDLEQALG